MIAADRPSSATMPGRSTIITCSIWCWNVNRSLAVIQSSHSGGLTPSPCRVSDRLVAPIITPLASFLEIICQLNHLLQDDSARTNAVVMMFIQYQLLLML